ncbi:MAG: twitching motility protein [Gammaproteobacteria bacterium]|nr:twitching motility protein [Gammaproteobacteria bacterium]MDR3665696.1 hypothetical protein [Ignavibacteriaceae bacterium]
MELKQNQSSIIIEDSADGEINVDVTSPDIKSLSGRICIAIAKKIMNDEKFQEQIMDSMEADLDNDDES